MDKTAKKVLKYIANQGKDYFGGLVDECLRRMASDIGMSKAELYAALVYLKSENYIEFFRAYGVKEDNAFRLTHEGMHHKAIRNQQIKKYVADKWIDFLALIISIVAFIQSCIALTN